MARQTIIYIGSLAFPNGNAGATHAVEIGKILHSCGYNVVFIGATRDISKQISILETESRFDNFVYYTNSRIQFLASITAVKEVLATYRETLAGVIAVNYPAIPLYHLFRYCSVNNIPLIAECTEWYAAREGNIVYRLFKWIDIHLRMRIVTPKIGNVICISRFLESYYSQKKCRTVYIPSIIDKQDPKWRIDAHQFNGNKNIRRFVYAGSPGTKDGLHTILKAFNKVMRNGHNFEFHIIGTTKEDLLLQYPDLKQVTHELGLRVKYHGRIPHERVISYIKGSDFTIFVRNKDRVSEAGFPTKFAESLACGVPSITNKTSDIGDYLVNGKNGLLIEANSIEAVEGILLKTIDLSKTELDSMKQYCLEFHGLDYHSYSDAACHFMDLVL